MSEKLAVCQFDAGSELPSWVHTSVSFRSITFTPDEVSVVLLQSCIPGEGVICEKGWRALRVDGKLNFSLCGVLSSLLDLLHKASVSVFVVSTYNTDYILVKEQQVGKALQALRESYSVNEEK